MDFMELLSSAAGVLVKHADIISLVIDLIESKGADKEAMIKALKQSAIAASDAEMSREFPKG